MSHWHKASQKTWLAQLSQLFLVQIKSLAQFTDVLSIAIVLHKMSLEPGTEAREHKRRVSPSPSSPCTGSGLFRFYWK